MGARASPTLPTWLHLVALLILEHTGARVLLALGSQSHNERVKLKHRATRMTVSVHQGNVLSSPHFTLHPHRRKAKRIQERVARSCSVLERTWLTVIPKQGSGVLD